MINAIDTRPELLASVLETRPANLPGASMRCTFDGCSFQAGGSDTLRLMRWHITGLHANSGGTEYEQVAATTPEAFMAFIEEPAPVYTPEANGMVGTRQGLPIGII